MSLNTSLHERLFDIAIAATNYRSHFKAEIDGWILQILCSDFGYMFAMAKKDNKSIEDDKSIIFELGPGKTWYPLGLDTKPEDIEILVALAERANLRRLNG